MTALQRFKSYMWPDTLTEVHKLLECKNPAQGLRLPVLRTVSVLIFAGILFHSYFALEGYRLNYLIAFTQWGIFITAFTFIVLLACVFINRGSSFGKFINRLGYVFFEISWTAEVVITIVFWAILVVVDFEKAHDFDWEVLAFLGETHLIPITLLALEFTSNKVRFTKSHAIFAAIPPTLYTGVSIFFSLVYDIHVYPILTWKDYKSAIFGLIITALFAAGFFSGYHIGEYKTRRRERRHRTAALLIVNE